jgi:hypothetical protein
VRDEVLDKLLKLFSKQPIWKKEQLYKDPLLTQYDQQTLSYIIQNAIEYGFELKDVHGRIGHLEAKDDVYAFGVGVDDTMLERLIQTDNGKAIPLPTKGSTVGNTEESLATTEQLNAIKELFDNHVWKNSYIVPRFDEDIRHWYLLDTVLSRDEKVEAMLSIDNWDNPPIYARDLIITLPDETHLFVLGSKRIYNDSRELVTPIGDQETAYREWIAGRKEWFVNHKNDLFASMKEDGIIFNLDDKATEVKRGARSKTIGGRMCSTYKETLLNKFSEWLSEPFPAEVKKKEGRCEYLSLLIREAVRDGKEGIFWVTPEEYEIFNEDEHRMDLLKKLKD